MENTFKKRFLYIDIHPSCYNLKSTKKLDGDLGMAGNNLDRFFIDGGLWRIVSR